MGRLLSKPHAVSPDGAMLVNFAANRAGGAQVGRSELASQECVPFLSGGGGSALADRKYLLVTFPIDEVYVGESLVSESTSYFSDGSGRNTTGSGQPEVNAYSSRKQFLRGQYLWLRLRSDVKLNAHISSAVKAINSLELS